MFDLLPSFNDVFKTFEDPQRLHAMMVHIPIAFALLGFVLTLGVTLTGSKASGLRWTTVFILLLGTLGALWASYTGEESEAHLPIKPTGEAADLLDRHKQLAEFFWISLAATGLFVLLSTVRVTWFRSVSLVFALLCSIVSVGWVASIAHYGGEIVYRHSVGVPSAGTDHIHTDGDETKDNRPLDKDTAKDKAIIPDKDGDKSLPTPKDAVDPIKDAIKDKASDIEKDIEKDSKERKLPDIESKDKSIFDP